MSKAYREAGVDIEEGERAVEAMKHSVSATFNPAVLSKMGDFAGLFDLGAASKGMVRPVLVASTDGVGTKVDVASRMERWDTVGQCLVHHCINDILVQGAEPIFFLDFIGCNKLESGKVAQIVLGMSKACGVHGVALLGGETAEMGGTYSPGSFEVAGTIVGLVDYPNILNGSTIQPGDEVWAFPSTGLHTNGYTLARKIVADLDWKTYEFEGRPIGEHLLAVHRCYLPEVRALRALEVDIRGLAHVTGGGLRGNFKRILPEGTGAELSLANLEPPPIFDFLRRRGNLTFDDMERTFNLGAGMLIIGPADSMQRAVEQYPDLKKMGVITDDSEIVVRA